MVVDTNIVHLPGEELLIFQAQGAEHQRSIRCVSGRRQTCDSLSSHAVDIESDGVVAVHYGGHMGPHAGRHVDGGGVVVPKAIGGEAQAGALGAEAPAPGRRTRIHREDAASAGQVGGFDPTGYGEVVLELSRTADGQHNSIIHPIEGEGRCVAEGGAWRVRAPRWAIRQRAVHGMAGDVGGDGATALVQWPVTGQTIAVIAAGQRLNFNVGERTVVDAYVVDPPVEVVAVAPTPDVDRGRPLEGMAVGTRDNQFTVDIDGHSTLCQVVAEDEMVPLIGLDRRRAGDGAVDEAHVGHAIPDHQV